MQKPIITLLTIWMISTGLYGQKTPAGEPETWGQAAPDTVSIIGVGDMMLGTDYPNAGYLPPNNDCAPLLSEVTGILKDADVTFGNLEGCFLNEGPVAKRCSDPSLCYAFRMPESYVGCFVENGFDVVSIANNHSRDFGQKGVETTERLLKENGIEYAGFTTCPQTIFEKDGITYGFAAFAPNTGTVSISDYTTARRIVGQLEEKCDIVIVSFHGGAEGSKHQHVPKKTEYFYGENRGNVYEFARVVIDAGADIVFGHGPHVTRAMDIYKDRFIAYSLGNFCTYARFNLSGANGLAPIVKVYTDKEGKFLKGQIYATRQLGQGGVKKDPNGLVISKVIELIKADMPETKLQVNTNGEITQKE